MKDNISNQPPASPQSGARTSKDDALEREMIDELLRALTNPERRHFAPGEYLLREGQFVDGVFVVLEGTVQLFRTIDGSDVIFHAQTVGRVVGLLALTLETTSYFDCRATTSVVALHLTLERLQAAMDQNPPLSRTFATVLTRSLSRRNRRSVEQHLEIANLNKKLATERDQLATALRDLKNAEALLVEREKMATLGQMSAGVAHELNNPTAAMARAAEFIYEDTRSLLQNYPEHGVPSMMETAYRITPCSTREERTRRKELTEELGDRDLANAFAELGIHQRSDAEKLFGSLDSPEVQRQLPALQTAHRLGASLRNVHTCSQRVTDLVRSLKSFARVDTTIERQIDVLVGLEESLLLLNSALRTVEVVKDYGDTPKIDCIPGQLFHVWTNILSNALQAMEGRGALHIHTAPDGPHHILVDIQDSGPGIPPENVDRIFDLNFTTRQGRLNYGLGMGLPICREIILRHHGTLTVASQPGKTTFTARLPIHPAQSV